MAQALRPSAAVRRLAADQRLVRSATCAGAALLQTQVALASTDGQAAGGIWGALRTAGLEVYNGLLSLVIIVAAIAFIIAMFIVIFSSSPQKVEKGKDWAIRIGFGVLFVFLAPYLFQTLKEIGATSGAPSMSDVVNGG